MKHLCLNCEKADMVRGKKDKVVEYRGEQITVAAVNGCPYQYKAFMLGALRSCVPTILICQ